MKRFALIVCLCLAGCATAPPPLDVQVKCPPLRTWSQAEQTALADAMAKIPQDSILWQLEIDWQAERDAIRACRSK